MCKYIDIIICAYLCSFLFFVRYQYYLQVKKDVLDGRLISSFEQGIRLAGLAVQGRTTWLHSLCPGMALLVCPLSWLGTEALSDSYSQQLGFQLIPKCMGGLLWMKHSQPQGGKEGPQCSTFLLLKFMQANLNKTPVLPALTTEYFAIMNLLHVLWFEMQITSKSMAAALILPLIKNSFCCIVLYEVWKNAWP